MVMLKQCTLTIAGRKLLAELKAKGVKLLDETPRTGHGGSRIAFLNPESTGNILIELAQLPAGH